jgi:hypothetical protein
MTTTTAPKAMTPGTRVALAAARKAAAQAREKGLDTFHISTVHIRVGRRTATAAQARHAMSLLVASGYATALNGGRYQLVPFDPEWRTA